MPGTTGEQPAPGFSSPVAREASLPALHLPPSVLLLKKTLTFTKTGQLFHPLQISLTGTPTAHPGRILSTNYGDTSENQPQPQTAVSLWARGFLNTQSR